MLITGASGDANVQFNSLIDANQGVRFFAISASGLGPVTIDGNDLVGLGQGIVADQTGDLNNVTVTNNAFTDIEEGIRVLQDGLSISGNTFNNTGAFTAFVIDDNAAYILYILNAVLTNKIRTLWPRRLERREDRLRSSKLQLHKFKSG